MNNNLPLKELSVNDVFNGGGSITYEIPIYQRNYAWEKKEIETLVNDIEDARKKAEDACGKTDGTYYIGTLVTYDKGEGIFEVIDGQQRLTTLFLLLKALGVNTGNILTYRARTRSIMALDRIEKKEDFSPDRNKLDQGIIDGYKHISQTFKNREVSEKEKFVKFLLEKVRIVHYNVPKDIDLNHYFEVMNSRGEQLEKHEIVKAKLMNVLKDEKDKSKFAAIWDSCSEMNTYIQTKASVQAYFESDLKDLKFYDGTFDILPEVNESALGKSSLKNLIHSVDNMADKKPDSDDDSKNSMFQPIIDFPNFLLIVLKITRMGDKSFSPYDLTLDDKELINEFDIVLKNQEITDDVKRAFAKQFCFNLLKAKYFLDNYVVHHTNEEDTYEHNPWQLRYWSKEEKGCTKNLYGNNKDTDKDKDVNHDIVQDKMVQLLSMFEVSFTARQRKNYLFYVLYHLSKNRDKDDYSKFVESLAKKYFYDIYMYEGRLNEINTPIPRAFDQAIMKGNEIVLEIANSNATIDRFNRRYGDGSEMTNGVPQFIFNYMDYLLWKYITELASNDFKKDNEVRRQFFTDLGCSDFGLEVFKQFYFSRTRNTLEHYYPQALVSKYPDIITENQINCFGNFAMISGDANSSGSDWTPKAKLLRYLDPSKKIRQVGVASLKFRIMMQMCHDNDNQNSGNEGHEWTFNDIKEHQNLMLKILFEQ